MSSVEGRIIQFQQEQTKLTEKFSGKPSFPPLTSVQSDLDPRYSTLVPLNVRASNEIESRFISQVAEKRTSMFRQAQHERKILRIKIDF